MTAGRWWRGALKYLRRRRGNHLERCTSATGKIMQVVEPWA